MVSVISNLAGNTALTKVLSDGTTLMIFGGVFLYTGAYVLKGMFDLLFQIDTIAKLNMVVKYPDEVKRNTSRIINYAAAHLLVVFHFERI